MIETHDNPVSFHPWQLGLEPPAGTFFELGGDAGAGGGGVDLGAAGTAVAEPPAAAAAADDAGAGAGAGTGDLGAAAGGDVEYLTTEDIASLVRENAGSAFAEMLQRAEAEQQAKAQAARAATAREAANTAPEWDPFDPESVNKFVEWRAQQLIAPLQEQLAQASQFVEQGQLEAGRSQAEEILSGFHKELGDFDHGKTILQAAAYMRQGVDPEQALTQAASEQAAYEQAIEARAVEKFKTAGQALADAGVEPAGGAGAAADVTAPLNGAGQRIDYKSAAKASLARMGRGPGVGEGVG